MSSTSVELGLLQLVKKTMGFFIQYRGDHQEECRCTRRLAILHIEEILRFYSVSSSVRVINTMEVWYVWHIARMEEIKCSREFVVRKCVGSRSVLRQNKYLGRTCEHDCTQLSNLAHCNTITRHSSLWYLLTICEHDCTQLSNLAHCNTITRHSSLW
jgi:hypothetical protein